MDKLWPMMSDLMQNNPFYEAPLVNKLAVITLDLFLGVL